MRRFIAVLLVLCAAVPAQAKDLRPLSLRELTYRANAVVVAVPLDSVASGRFKVTTVLRGGVKVDATITLAESDRNFYSLRAFVPHDPDDPPPLPTAALLFLAAPVEPGKPVQLVSSGLFLGMANADVLAPRQLSNPGGWTMTLQEGRVWQVLVKDAKTAATAVNEVLHLKAARGRERTAGLLRWVERHRQEFGGGFFDDDRIGWGSLETDVFDWVCAKGQPDECWTAARFYAELNHGAALPLRGPYFSTPAGRDLLLRVALNERALAGDRARALTLLTHPRTLTPAADASRPDIAPCSKADVAALVRKLAPLLETKSDTLRMAALTALRAVWLQYATATPLLSEWKKLLSLLDRAYKAEKPDAYRDLLIEMIYTLGGAEHWKDVSGNKSGMVALLRDVSRSNGEVHFWLQVLPATDKIYERPTLVLERLDAKDKVLETKTLPLPVVNAPRWENGWTPGDLLLVQFPSDAMSVAPRSRVGRGIYGGPTPRPTPNSGQTVAWRVTVRGTVGKEKKAWSSEAKLFPVASLPKVNEGVEIDDFNRPEK